MTCAKAVRMGSLLAEHAFALILSLTRGIAAIARLNRWDSGSDEAQSAYELGGKTLGIVGYGGVGTALAQRARALIWTFLPFVDIPKTTARPAVGHGSI